MKTPIWFQYPRFEWQNRQAVIIGGGLAGSQMCWHLRQAGWQVTLLERHAGLASEASGNPAGVISPKMTAKASPGEDFYRNSFHYTQTILKKLERQGIKIRYNLCGVLQLTHNERELKRWHELKARHLGEDFIQLLDEKQSSQVAGIELPFKSSYFPEGGWINPADYANALCSEWREETAGAQAGCKIIKQTQIISLQKNGKQWQLVDSAHNLIAQAEVVIIANGKDLHGFAQSAFLPGVPVAGQTTFAEASDYSKHLKTVIGHEGYLTPALHSDCSQQPVHIFGATFERDCSAPQIRAESDRQNYDSLQNYLPEFAHSLGQRSSAHVAVRMTTPDRFPYVGALPHKAFYEENYHDLHQGKKWKKYPQAKYQQGLFVLGGLGSRGVISSAYCAKALCELLENKAASENTQKVLNNCHPARFIIRKLIRKQ